MKRYVCFKCIAFGGKSPCVLACENDLIPTHCPHDDSKYPNAHWELDASQPTAARGQRDLCGLRKKTWHIPIGKLPEFLHLKLAAGELNVRRLR